MVKFLIKLTVFVTVVLTVWLVLLFIPSNDYQDRFKMKFEGQCGSMITGSSRALLAMSPDIIDPNGFFADPFLNFAFTQKTSPYGETYYNAIAAKLNSSGNNGIFLVEVNPLALYTGSDSLPEENLILGRLHFFNLNPNPEYVLINSERPLYQLYIKSSKVKSGTVYHKSGWNENTVSVDTVLRKQKIAESVVAHEKLFKEWRDPSYRFYWFSRTLELFKTKGKVIIVRVPVRPEMRALEEKYYPGFDQLMDSVATANSALYWNYFRDDQYDFYDIHHMSSESAKRFSSELNRRLVHERILPKQN